MQETENQRIKFLRKELNLTQSELASKLGVKQNTISSIEKGVNNVTESLKKSLNAIFMINISWIETGKGEMFSKDSATKSETHTNEIEMSKLIESLEKIIATQDKLIVSLETEKLRLQNENDMLRSKLEEASTGRKAG